MLSWVWGRFQTAILGAGAVLVAVLAAFFAGIRSASERAEKRVLERQARFNRRLAEVKDRQARIANDRPGEKEFLDELDDPDVDW